MEKIINTQDILLYIYHIYIKNILKLNRNFFADIKGRVVPNPRIKFVKRGESQAHGFIWEEEILRKVYGVKTENYTSIHDLSAERNKIDGVNLSIKTTGGKSVDMGDVKRIYQEISNISDKSYMNLTVLFYTQKKKYKKLYKIVELKLYRYELQDLFGNLSLKEISSYIDYVKDIPHGNPGVEKRQEYKQKQKILNEQTGFIKIRTKVDTKKQRRVQCSFPDFLKFCEEKKSKNLKSVIINEECKLRGKCLTNKLFSTRRKLKTSFQEKNKSELQNKNWNDLTVESLKQILREAKKKNNKIRIGGYKEELVQRVSKLFEN